MGERQTWRVLSGVLEADLRRFPELAGVVESGRVEGSWKSLSPNDL